MFFIGLGFGVHLCPACGECEYAPPDEDEEDY